MEQIEIVRRTRKMFEESGKVPQIRDVDPLATHTEISAVELANKLMKINHEDLTEKEKNLKGFFTAGAKEQFTVTGEIEYVSGRLCRRLVNPQFRRGRLPVQLNASDAKAPKTLKIKSPPPCIRFSPESHSNIQTFLTSWLPSSTLQSQVAWICVDNAHPKHMGDKGITDSSGLHEAWNNICASRQPAIADLDDLA
jgi:hypothetical protein